MKATHSCSPLCTDTNEMIKKEVSLKFAQKSERKLRYCEHQLQSALQWLTVQQLCTDVMAYSKITAATDDGGNLQQLVKITCEKCQNLNGASAEPGETIYRQPPFASLSSSKSGYEA